MPRASRSAPPEVYKFGGASLGEGAAFLHAAQIVARCRAPLAVVCSAPAGATDLLLEVADKARHGETAKARAGVRALREKFGGVLAALSLPDRARDELAATV